MTTITVTPELLDQLHGLNRTLEFRDEHGRLLGRFEPSTAQHLMDDLQSSCPFTEVQLRERELQPQPSGKSTAEILRELNAKWPIN